MRAVTVLTGAAVAVATVAIVAQGPPPAINERGLACRESLLRDLRLRVRDVRGPDGNLYLAIDDAKSGILRIEPAS